ncbi:MAG: CHASE2 domain-containing protein, partial [Desulfobacterales bacterium]|nr:CHASE2 domain-containing protein [Desulfobacterales bacterium]
PLPEFSDAMVGDGFIDLPLDRGDVLRRIRFLAAKPVGDQGLALIPSFSLELVRVWKNLEFSFDFSHPNHLLMGADSEDQLALPYPELLIDFSGDYSAFPQISFSDAMAGRFDDKTVAGRMVLIGSVRALEKDFLTTPFTRFRNVLHGYDKRFGALVEDFAAQKEPGVACHAHAVETLLRGSWIRKVSSHWTLGLFLLAGLAGILFFVPGVSLRWAVIVFIGVELSLLATAHLMFQSARLWLPIVPAGTVFMGQFVAGAVLQKVYEQRRNAVVTNLFGKYVSPAVVADILEHDLDDALAGQRREVSILFSDLRGFTTLSERLGARRTGRLLNAYFDAMLPLVFAHEGTLDKLMGDAVMAFYGAPAVVAEHPVRAAETALSMLDALEDLKRGGEPDAEALEIGIGLNTGEVTVGNLGSADFMDYTIIGDAVNLASRLEGLNKTYKTRVIASQETARRLDPRFIVRELDRVRVKGKTGAVTIFELAGYRQRVSEARISALTTFEAGLAAFRQRQWDRAESLFSEVLDRIADDGPSLCYLDRIEALRKHPPAKDWDGVAVFI